MKRASMLVAGVLALVAGWRWLPGVFAPATDYDREIQRFDREIRSLEARDPATLDWTAARRLVFQVYRRASLTAVFDDFRRAESAIDAAIAKWGPREDLVYLRACLDFKLHRIERAKASMRQLAHLSDRAPMQLLAADVAVQEGRYGEARAMYAASVDDAPTWDALAREAWLKSKTGDGAGADALYAQAEDEVTVKEMRSYAWLELQRGILDLDRGAPAEALAHYLRAAKAYSGYWLIEEHVAEAYALLGRTDESVALYRKIAARTRNPEYVSALAEVLAASDPAESARLHAEAESLFAAQRALYPEAAIGHYLRHRIERGEPTPDLLPLAEENVRLRPNGESKTLLAEACVVMNDLKRAKTILDEVRSTAWRAPEVDELAARIERGGAK